jgi:hypothetical protein
MKRSSRGLGIVGAALAAMLLGGSPALPVTPSGPGFDGLWSVLIITDSGECDRAYRYSLRVNKGAVSYQGDPGGIDVDVSGRIDQGGRVNVSISRGQQKADGIGRLANGRGTGTWQGKSPTAQCSGRWEAERRG